MGKNYISVPSHLFREMMYGKQQCVSTTCSSLRVPFMLSSATIPRRNELAKKSSCTPAPSSQLSWRNCSLIKSVPITRCPNPLRPCLHVRVKTDPRTLLSLHLEMPRHMPHLTGFKDVFLWITNIHSSDSKYQQERVPRAFLRAISSYPSDYRMLSNPNGRDIVPSKS